MIVHDNLINLAAKCSANIYCDSDPSMIPLLYESGEKVNDYSSLDPHKLEKIKKRAKQFYKKQKYDFRNQFEKIKKHFTQVGEVNFEAEVFNFEKMDNDVSPYKEPVYRVGFRLYRDHGKWKDLTLNPVRRFFGYQRKYDRWVRKSQVAPLGSKSRYLLQQTGLPLSSLASTSSDILKSAVASIPSMIYVPKQEKVLDDQLDADSVFISCNRKHIPVHTCLSLQFVMRFRLCAEVLQGIQETLRENFSGKHQVTGLEAQISPSS